MRISDWSSDVCSSDLVNARLEAIDVEIGALVDRPISFDPADMAHAGAFMSIEVDGSLRIERGYVRPEDEPAARRRQGNFPGDFSCSRRNAVQSRSEEHTSELQSLMRNSYAVLCLQKKTTKT